MSLKTRDIEDLIKRHGWERGMRKAVMLLTETVVAQQEAMMDLAKTIDALSVGVEVLSNTQIAAVTALKDTRRKLGHDIDEGGVASEPISDIGEGGQH